jgi:hypothetical protein
MENPKNKVQLITQNQPITKRDSNKLKEKCNREKEVEDPTIKAPARK